MTGILGFFTVLGLGGTDSQFLSISAATSDTLTSNYGLTSINNYTRYASSVCETNCNQTISNTTVIISPGAQVGPVTFTQQCTIENVNCAIDALIDASLPDILKSIQESINNGTFDATSDFGYGITPEMIKSVEDLNITIKNNVQQMISSQCTFETNQTLNNNVVYVGTGATTGAISFSQTATISNVDCAIDVITKNSTYNNETSAPPENTGNIVAFLIIFVIIVLLIGIILTIIFMISNGDKESQLIFSGNPDYSLDPQIYYDVNANLYPTKTLYYNSQKFI
jgi:hypothetical protein